MLKTVPQLYPWILTILYCKELLLYKTYIHTFLIIGFFTSISSLYTHNRNIHRLYYYFISDKNCFFLSNQSVIKIFINYIKYNMLQIAKNLKTIMVRKRGRLCILCIIFFCWTKNLWKMMSLLCQNCIEILYLKKNKLERTSRQIAKYNSSKLDLVLL